MRITFVLSALAVFAAGVELTSQIDSAVDLENYAAPAAKSVKKAPPATPVKTAKPNDIVNSTKGAEAAKEAKDVLSKAKTTSDKTPLEKPFAKIENEIDQKIARQEKRVKDGVANVKQLNKVADDGLDAARKAVADKASAQAARVKAEQDLEGEVKKVKKAIGVADKQVSAQRKARKAHSEAFKQLSGANKSL